MVNAHLTGKDRKMKQMLGLLFVSLLGGVWLSLKEAQCQISPTRIPGPNIPYCYNTSSGKTCFTTLLVDSRTARKPLEEASHWCKTYVLGSSLIVINSLEIQRAFEGFIFKQVLQHEAIIMDARMLSASESSKWSWVNGQPYSSDVSKDITSKAKEFHDGVCVESKSKPSKSVNYCFGNVTSMFRYICELSDSKSASSYRQGNKSYVASEANATWYDARKECLRLNGDLASITDLRTIISWSSLKENQPYWIGLHRNKWIWNSTGAALTYTNWKNGFPEESSDSKCICFSQICTRRNEKTTAICDADYDRKWWTCNCNRNYTIVCQKNFPFPEEKILSSTTPDFKSSVTLSAETSTQLRLSSSSPSFSASTSGQFNTKEILLILLLFVAVVCIMVAIILIIRKRKYDKRNEGSSSKNTTQSEAVSSVYATVVPVNRPSEVTVPPCNTIYAEVEMIKKPTPPSNNAIYASVQPTSEAIDMGKSVVYADLDYPKKDQQKPSSADKMTACLSLIYSQPYEPRSSATNTEYAEPFKPDKKPTATAPVINHNAVGDQQNVYSLAKAIPLGDPNAIYAEPNKPNKSSTPMGKAAEATAPIYLNAIEVGLKHEAERGGVATQDPSAVYAEPIKLKSHLKS